MHIEVTVRWVITVIRFLDFWISELTYFPAFFSLFDRRRRASSVWISRPENPSTFTTRIWTTILIRSIRDFRKTASRSKKPSRHLKAVCFFSCSKNIWKISTDLRHRKRFSRDTVCFGFGWLKYFCFFSMLVMQLIFRIHTIINFPNTHKKGSEWSQNHQRLSYSSHSFVMFNFYI